jgi:hypothetical protein
MARVQVRGEDSGFGLYALILAWTSVFLLVDIVVSTTC